MHLRHITWVCLLLGLLPPAAQAAKSWLGGTNYWTVASNWSSGTIPVAGDDVIITNLTRGALVYLSNSTPALASLTVAGSAAVVNRLVFTNWNASLQADNVTIQSNGLITCAGPFTNLPPTYTNASYYSNRVYVICQDFLVAAGGSVNVDGKGYAGALITFAAGNGPGRGGASPNNVSGGGGGYGGAGGA
ncbi:MAG: G8 domain-containing protein, partial [Lentisphaerae bacterium]|nr:G8 domain-containing protein [Lentisphaerota bacterium]